MNKLLSLYLTIVLLFVLPTPVYANITMNNQQRIISSTKDTPTYVDDQYKLTIDKDAHTTSTTPNVGEHWYDKDTTASVVGTYATDYTWYRGHGDFTMNEAKNTTVESQPIIPITVTITGAINDTITINDPYGTRTCTTNSSGIASNVRIGTTADGRDITLTSNVAKALTDITKNYTKVIHTTPSTTDIKFYPEKSTFWYGIKPYGDAGLMNNQGFTDNYVKFSCTGNPCIMYSNVKVSNVEKIGYYYKCTRNTNANRSPEGSGGAWYVDRNPSYYDGYAVRYAVASQTRDMVVNEYYSGYLELPIQYDGYLRFYAWDNTSGINIGYEIYALWAE